jgi:hypothetical protein
MQSACLCLQAMQKELEGEYKILVIFGGTDWKLIIQWVETNPSNIHFFPSDNCFTSPHGTMLTAYGYPYTDVRGC